MTIDEMQELLEEVIQEQERETLRAGQREYAHSSAFANFERIATGLDVTREAVLFVYLAKHIDGIKAFVSGHESQRENIRGRILDARLYLALLWGMIAESDSCEERMQSRHEALIVDGVRYPTEPPPVDPAGHDAAFHEESIANHLARLQSDGPPLAYDELESDGPWRGELTYPAPMGDYRDAWEWRQVQPQKVTPQCSCGVCQRTFHPRNGDHQVTD